MEISMIAAIGNHNVIGYKGRMPWGRLPADLEYFQKITMDKVVVIGRVTYEGICAVIKKPLGSTLSRRKIIIISKTKNLNYECTDITLAISVEDALRKAYSMHTTEIMVAGGESVYKIFLNRANKLYITHINGNFPGDRYFPKFSIDNWEIFSQYSREADNKNPFKMKFKVFNRIMPIKHHFI